MTKFEVGQIYKTRDGRDAKILYVDAPSKYPIIGYVDGTPCSWTSSGLRLDAKHERWLDLIPPKRTRETTVWVNVYPDCECFFETETSARQSVGSKALAVAVPVKITVEW